MHGPTSSARLGSFQPWTSCRPIGFRRRVAEEMARDFSQVDLLLVPSLRDEMLTIAQLHRSAVSHHARRIRQGLAGAERLGAGSEESLADVLAASTGTTRHDVDRAAVRRRDDRPRRGDARAGVRRGAGTTHGLLNALERVQKPESSTTESRK